MPLFPHLIYIGAKNRKVKVRLGSKISKKMELGVCCENLSCYLCSPFCGAFIRCEAEINKKQLKNVWNYRKEDRYDQHVRRKRS